MTLDQLKKLDTCWFPFSLADKCIEETIDARQLLGAGRFDLYAILLYIDCRVKGLSNIDYFKSVYNLRTGALTKYEFPETGKPHKDSYEAYSSDLDKLIESHLNGTYDNDKYYIPVDKNGILIDGAHRVSCAAYFDKKIKILKFVEKEAPKTSYKTLINNALPLDAADAMALESTKWHDNLFMFLFWPLSSENNDALGKSLSLIDDNFTVFYEKKQALTANAIRNLMIQVYGHMDWLGNIDNDFRNVNSKVDAVWAPKGICHFVLVQAQSTEDILRLKGKIRDIFNCGLASVHSTDNIRETRIAANALFNSNSFHFINYGTPTKHKESYKLFHDFKQMLVQQGRPLDNYLIDSGMSMAIYGLRESTDLDYICEPSDTLIDDMKTCDQSKIENHGSKQLTYYSLSEKDLLYNPSNYYTFEEMKFVSMHRLMKFKQLRYKQNGDLKDRNDEKLITSVVGNSNKNKIKREFERACWDLHRIIWITKRRVKKVVKNILRNTGLLETISKFLRGRKIKKNSDE